MKWFKHDTDASRDAKIQKLILRYGAEGYGVYWYCIELIAGNISEKNITFELEHDAEIIADNLKIKSTPEKSPIDRVNEMMKYIVKLKLFSENSKGGIFCFKILNRLDTSMTGNKQFREIINIAKVKYEEEKEKQRKQDKPTENVYNHDKVMTESCYTRLDYTTQDDIILEKTKEEELQSEDCSLHKHIFEKFSVEYKNLYNIDLDFTPKEVGSIANIKKTLKNKDNPEKEFDNKFEILRNRCKDQRPPSDFWKLTPSMMYSQWANLTPPKKQSYKDDPFYL